MQPVKSTKIQGHKVEFYISKAKNKKYAAVIDGKKTINFGDKRYEQYNDKLGVYKKLNHNDEKRKKAYYSRHGETNDIFSAKFYSNKFLW